MFHNEYCFKIRACRHAVLREKLLKRAASTFSRVAAKKSKRGQKRNRRKGIGERALETLCVKACPVRCNTAELRRRLAPVIKIIEQAVALVMAFRSAKSVIWEGQGIALIRVVIPFSTHDGTPKIRFYKYFASPIVRAAITSELF